MVNQILSEMLEIKNKNAVENLGSWIDPKIPKNKSWIIDVYDPYDLTVKSYIQIHHANLYLLSKKFFLCY